MENTEFKKYSGLKDYLNNEIEEEEENELDKSCRIIQKDISEIQKDLRSCNSVEEKCELRKRAFYSLECVDRQIRKEKPNPEADKLICRSVGGIVAQNMTNFKTNIIFAEAWQGRAWRGVVWQGRLI